MRDRMDVAGKPALLGSLSDARHFNPERFLVRVRVQAMPATIIWSTHPKGDVISAWVSYFLLVLFFCSLLHSKEKRKVHKKFKIY